MDFTSTVLQLQTAERMHFNKVFGNCFMMIWLELSNFSTKIPGFGTRGYPSQEVGHTLFGHTARLSMMHQCNHPDHPTGGRNRICTQTEASESPREVQHSVNQQSASKRLLLHSVWPNSRCSSAMMAQLQHHDVLLSYQVYVSLSLHCGLGIKKNHDKSPCKTMLRVICSIMGILSTSYFVPATLYKYLSLYYSRLMSFIMRVLGIASRNFDFWPIVLCPDCPQWIANMQIPVQRPISTN